MTITVKDFKGRIYKVRETGAAFTLLECMATTAMIRLPSTGWERFGFRNQDKIVGARNVQHV